MKTFLKVLKNNLRRRSFANKCNMCWNIGLKESYKNLKSWFGSWFFTKNGKKPFDSICRTMRIKVALNDVGARKNGAKT